LKKYTLEFKVDDNNRLSIAGCNEGFNSLELLGVFKWKLDDIIQQIEGKIKPDTVKRTVVKEQEAGN